MRIIAIFILLLFTTSVWGQNLEKIRLLAKQGDAEAQYQLGRMYHTGRFKLSAGTVQSVTRNSVEAIRWYREAAEQGHDDAQFWLGVMYEYGNGVPRNYRRAHMWMNIGASQGNKRAYEGRTSVAAKMNRADINNAQQMAERCVMSNYKECDQ